jgi:hypothetical protein
MKYVSVVALFLSGAIHVVPVSGVAGAAALTRMYGIDVADPNTSVLLQHRALLFGMLALLMFAAIPVPSLRWTALTLGLFSAASFVVVALWVGNSNAAIARVVFADVVATALLAAGLVTELLLARARA